MKKIDFGRSVTALANLGVLVGIFLLLYELNQNRQMMKAQIRNDLGDTLVNILVQEATVPEIITMQVKRRTGEDLTLEDQRSFQMLQSAYWRYRESVHYQYRNGLFEDSEYAALQGVWVDALNNDEMVRAVWCFRQNYRASIQLAEEMNAMMREPCE